MPYRHAGEIGDVWKHLPLCDILALEKPLRYHETNAAYSGYAVGHSERTDYGIFHVLDAKSLQDSKYIETLKKNGIDQGRYTGSPGLAMDILADGAKYYFHDIEPEAIRDVLSVAKKRGLEHRAHAFCTDSVQAFLSETYKLDQDDFVFLDPYEPFDSNEQGNSFFDIFEKALRAGSKTLLWYGYDHLQGKTRISQHISSMADRLKADIRCFDVWQKCMAQDTCRINPGVPGCGLAGANLSMESFDILEKYLAIIGGLYSHVAYGAQDATLLTGSAAYAG